jgi:hypothetical protein
MLSLRVQISTKVYIRCFFRILGDFFFVGSDVYEVTTLTAKIKDEGRRDAVQTDFK